jgi:DNA polymerase-3 subunit gamma/tau
VNDAKSFVPDQLQELFRIFTQAEDGLRLSTHPRFVLEVAAVRATRLTARGEPRTTTDQPTASRGQMSQPPAGNPAGAHVSPNPMSERPQNPGGTKVAPASGTRAHDTPAGQAPSVAKSSTATAPPSPARPESSPHVVPNLNWEQVLERIEVLHPQLVPFLSMGTPLIQKEEIRLVYSPKASVARGMVGKQENLRAVSDICERIAGRPIRIVLVESTDDAKQGPTMTELRAARHREQQEALLQRGRSHPLVKQALEIFGGDIVTAREQSPEKETR